MRSSRYPLTDTDLFFLKRRPWLWSSQVPYGENWRLTIVNINELKAAGYTEWPIILRGARETMQMMHGDRRLAERFVDRALIRARFTTRYRWDSPGGQFTAEQDAFLRKVQAKISRSFPRQRLSVRTHILDFSETNRYENGRRVNIYDPGEEESKAIYDKTRELMKVDDYWTKAYHADKLVRMLVKIEQQEEQYAK